MTLLDEVRRLLAEDARRRVTDTKPLYATAGAVDAAVDFFRKVPERLETAADRARVEWTPDRFGDAFADLVDDARDTADDAVRRLQEERAKITGPGDLAALARDATEQVLDEAGKAPGRLVVSVAETAGAAFETYDELAERGRAALAKLRGDAVPGETATSGRPGEEPPVFRRPPSPTPTPTGAPASTAPASTAPASTAPTSTAPASTAPTAAAPTAATEPTPAAEPTPPEEPTPAPVGHAAAEPPPAPPAPPNAAATPTAPTTDGVRPAKRPAAKRPATRKKAAPKPAAPDAVTPRRPATRATATPGDDPGTGPTPPANAARRTAKRTPPPPAARPQT